MIHKCCISQLLLISAPIGQSATYFGEVTYQSFRQQLVGLKSTDDDMTALNSLPDQVNEPVSNSNPNIWIKSAHARTLGFPTSILPQDSTISVNIGLCNLDRLTIDPNK